jgi:adenylate cyclase
MGRWQCISRWRFGLFIVGAIGGCRGVEVLRLAAGFSFPLLLINHAVSTRLGDALFGITPSYTLIITNLLAAGRQGMQLALLAPGWLHGCLGIWITLQRFRAMQRIKHLLVALVVLIPVLAAAGFLRMASEVLTIGPQLPTSSNALLHKLALASWDANLVKIYLGAVFSAFLLGRLRTFWPRLFRAGPVSRGIRRQMARCPRTPAPKLVDPARTRPL